MFADFENEHKRDDTTADKTFFVEIIRMKASDAPEVFGLAQKCALAYWSQIDYEKEARRENAFALIAKSSDKIIGFLVARLITTRSLSLDRQLIFKKYGQYPTQDSGHANVQPEEQKNAESSEIEAEIYNIAVLSEYRKKGVGGKLLSVFFSSLSGLIDGGSSVSIWLEVRESNSAALDFYRARGFEFVRKIKNFYRDPFEDALQLKAEIDGRTESKKPNRSNLLRKGNLR